MDGPALMSILEFYTQVGLRDRRRETAIQASKKERKNIYSMPDTAYRKATSSPAVRESLEKPDLGTSTWKAQRIGWSPSLGKTPGCSAVTFLRE